MKAFGVQFLSRNFRSPGIIGGRNYQAVPISDTDKLNFSVTLEYASGDPKYTFAQPWPQSPSIGAIEFVDPYQVLRWPALVSLTANIDISDPGQRSIEFAHLTLGLLRNVLWASFQSFSSLKAATDQRLIAEGYRRAYFTSTIDIDRNPVPTSNWRLARAEVDELVGPGFLRLDECVINNNYHCLVWSQAISFPNRTSIQQDKDKIIKRIQKVKCHWNARDEIRDAESFANQGKVKAAVRFAACAVDASLRYYSYLWNKPLPKNQKDNYIEKIEKFLKDAGRPSYQVVDPQSAKSLLKLYRARNTMHEGDRYYEDPDTNQRVIVDAPMAQDFVIEAKKFLFWLDSLT